MLLIKNAVIADAYEKKEYKSDILIDNNGKIVKIEPDISCECEIFDAKDMIVTNGLIDTHVHFRDPGLTYKEDIFTGANAAKKGGFTTVICMANTVPVMDNVNTLKQFYEKASQCDINVLTCAAVTEGLSGGKICDFEELLKHGAVGFTDDGINLADAHLTFNAMKQIKKHDTVISLHEEDINLVYSAGVNEGSVAAEHFNVKGATSLAEVSSIARDIAISKASGAKVCFQHVSCKDSVEFIKMGKKLGADIYAEVTPHHISLTQDDVIKYGTNAKMNPPLRAEADRLALIEGLKNGTIDIIATDHAPHSTEEKQKDFPNAPSGIIGLETSFALCYTYLVKENHLTFLELIEKMSVSPAKLYNLKDKEIKVGNFAEICIVKLDEMLDTTHFVSKSQNTPFIDFKLFGNVKATIMGDKAVYCD